MNSRKREHDQIDALDDIYLLLIEKCPESGRPATNDRGEHDKVVVLSVAEEGGEKPRQPRPKLEFPGAAAPSDRGSEAPKFVPVAESCNTACPRPISCEYSGRTLISCPIFPSASSTSPATRASIETSHPVGLPRKNLGASSAFCRFIP